MSNKIESDPLESRAAGWYQTHAKEVEASGRCPFCHLKSGYVITEKDDWILTTNIHPRSKGSLLVLPKRHIEHVTDLTDGDAVSRQNLEVLGSRLLTNVYGLRNFNFILRQGPESGKSVKHLHSHVMTYYHGVLKWWDEKDNPERVFKTPQEAGFPLIPAVEVASSLREALSKGGYN
jgi:diadenosine tetraphosphate (Ap4A) HIT family hydrolase